MALRQHLARLCLLIGLSAAVQAWVISHAVVPSQDAVRYLANAQAMQRSGWWTTLLAQNDPPLFPTLVYGTHELLQAIPGETLRTPERILWLRSLQWGAAVPIILSLLPLYVLLVRWMGTSGGGWGCLLYCVLAGPARLGADGLSDSLQLLLLLTACCGLMWILTSARGQRLYAPYVVAAVGACLGMGLLAGSVALALLPAIAVALVFDRNSDGVRLVLSRKLLNLAPLAAGVAAIVVPYALLTSSFDTGRLVSRVRGDHRPELAALLNFPVSAPIAKLAALDRPQPAADWRLANGEPMAFGHKEASVSLRARGLVSACGQFSRELAVMFGAPVIALALFGMWRADRTQITRVDRAFNWLLVVYSVIALAHAARSGYLSDRHLLPLLPWGLAWAGRGLVELGLTFERQLPWAEQWVDRWPRSPAAVWFSRFAAAGTVALCLTATLRPLHTSRWGHRQAAEWLAAQDIAAHCVLDTRGWTALYSGRPTYRHEAASAALANSQLAYIVVEQRELAVDSPRGRTLRELLDRSADRLMCFATPAEAVDSGVAIYRWHPERFAAQVSNRGPERR